jgi:hypothetical protein
LTSANFPHVWRKDWKHSPIAVKLNPTLLMTDPSSNDAERSAHRTGVRPRLAALRPSGHGGVVLGTMETPFSLVTWPFSIGAQGGVLH